MALAVAAGAVQADQTLLSQGFDDISTLAGSGWVLENRSADPSGNWFQGNSGVMTSQSGAPDSFIQANFLNANSGALSVWLITPTFDLTNGGSVSFYTRTDANVGLFADRLDVMMSQGGTASNQFSSTLLRVNAAQAADGYPDGWTQFTVQYAGAGSGVGRIAFVYDVSSVDAANSIGIDTVQISAVPEPATIGTMLAGLGVLGLALRRRSTRI